MAQRGAGAAAHYTYRLDADPRMGVLRFLHGQELEWECASEADMALHLIGQACYQLAYFSSGGLVMHAALVSRNGQGVLLPGSTGTGKSTLAAWLLRCGYDYLTDELVYIPDEGAQRGYGLRRPLNLKKAARPLLSNIFQISSYTTGVMTSASVDLIQHELFGKGIVLPHIPIGAMVFPRFRAEAAFGLRRLTKAQASLELMQCLINARNLPEHGFPEVVRLARTTPAYQMIYSDFSEVASAVQTVLQDSISSDRQIRHEEFIVGEYFGQYFPGILQRFQLFGSRFEQYRACHTTGHAGQSERCHCRERYPHSGSYQYTRTGCDHYTDAHAAAIA